MCGSAGVGLRVGCQTGKLEVLKNSGLARTPRKKLEYRTGIIFTGTAVFTRYGVRKCPLRRIFAKEYVMGTIATNG
jgi:hypothetical protein